MQRNVNLLCDFSMYNYCTTKATDVSIRPPSSVMPLSCQLYRSSPSGLSSILTWALSHSWSVLIKPLIPPSHHFIFPKISAPFHFLRHRRQTMTNQYCTRPIIANHKLTAMAAEPGPIRWREQALSREYRTPALVLCNDNMYNGWRTWRSNKFLQRLNPRHVWTCPIRRGPCQIYSCAQRYYTFSQANEDDLQNSCVHFFCCPASVVLFMAEAGV